ncbi:MAG: 4'-phosphopantetheinyl transferase superfamily protein [Rhodobacteraceae bacterium]|nr:4'-phosphopantetheinyl transferase superfamily protein [Paracoccaceae bacterium]TVR46249.1 MAG: 4'-phosphopantetheinyl transferase superfamily protein [Paracoccaceae bacterium]
MNAFARQPLKLDLWLWPLDLHGAARARLEAHLSGREHQRAAAFGFERDRRRFVCARGRLREILGDVTGTAPARLDFALGDHGKPMLAGGPAFNLSHSAGWAALAISPGPAIGIDIEACRPIEPGLADHVFSPAERAALAALAPADRLAGFFHCWTRKEAFVKASGLGLWQPLDSFDVTPDPASPPRVLRVAQGAAGSADWQMVALDLGPGFAGAVAAATDRPLRLCYRGHRPPLRPATD